jgi:N-acetylglucosaminyldiphosphoundecaprenol N-acetyl-beta-D-mannosaminyltransferase
MKQPPSELQHIDIGPTRLAVATMELALACTDKLIGQGGSHYICFCEANLLSRSSHDARLSAILKNADAVFADGVAVKLLARIRGYSLPERVPGPSFLLAACQYGLAHGWRHFFFGATPGVVDRLGEKLNKRFPGIQIAGVYSPPFRPLTEVEEAEIKIRIESGKPDLLWIGLGGPKQEFWCAQHLNKINVPVMLAVGAAFDFHSGRRPWAPVWIRKIGMEWAYRAVTGGRQTFFRNLRCVSVVAFQLFIAGLERFLLHPKVN